MARKRGQQRWSALLSRIAKHMRLDKDMWADFVSHANAHYKSAFVDAFESATSLVCVGPVGGSPCGFCVDLTSFSAFDRLGLLHLDHEQNLVVTCDMWRRALPKCPSDWGDGIHAGLLCHLLFSVALHPRYGAPMLRFRCGPGASCCHQLNMPHYGALRDVVRDVIVYGESGTTPGRWCHPAEGCAQGVSVEGERGGGCWLCG